ncbi:hypothetical protein HQN87_22025 [Paenibacillus tritici]|uniref:Copper amine oxidase-like N-terminal domain-containing protein n=1 Tax=Paenibacillus tritici TaxID=1873425 RepID=A0ABX2DTJ3_9BACL|nr:hypothetical protein [Paenibacillus tritici]NQX48008.1 hypothetical protein [Paenibacillus tritici]
MINKAGQKEPRGQRSRLLLCLILGLALFAASASPPPAMASKSSRTTVTQAVMQEALPGLAMKQIPSPETLQTFTKETIGKLSAHAPFTEWKDAGTEVYPLGPGTRSWLVNVMNGGQRIGYLIISAADQGGYVLSEYGAGTSGLPYSMLELRQYLVQQGLISSDHSATIELTPLYAPLLPLWKLTAGNKTFYLNASVPELLPWSPGQADTILGAKPDSAAMLSSSGPDQARTPLPALLSGGEDDPYADLLWITAPELKSMNGASLTALLRERGSLAFQSSGHNEALGAPFMITGSQSWLKTTSAGDPADSEAAVVYAAAGPGGIRYLPLTALQKSGTFHKPPMPLRGGTTLGAASVPDSRQ